MTRIRRIICVAMLAGLIGCLCLTFSAFAAKDVSGVYTFKTVYCNPTGNLYIDDITNTHRYTYPDNTKKMATMTVRGDNITISIPAIGCIGHDLSITGKIDMEYVTSKTTGDNMLWMHRSHYGYITGSYTIDQFSTNDNFNAMTTDGFATRLRDADNDRVLRYFSFENMGDDKSCKIYLRIAGRVTGKDYTYGSGYDICVITLSDRIAGTAQTDSGHASYDPGEDEGTGIIGGIIGGIAVAVGVGVAVSGGKKKKKSQAVGYRMYVYKDFGDSIQKGAPPVRVCARIAQIIEGREYDCLEQTRNIVPSGENLTVRPAGMNGKYMAAYVSADPASVQDSGAVTFTLKGPGGVYTRSVIFRIVGEPGIVFPGDTEDGKLNMSVRNDSVDLIAGLGGREKLRFVIRDAATEPVEIRFSQSDGLTITPEKDTRFQFTYYAVIDNHTSPVRKENGIFAEEEKRQITIWAKFSDGKEISGIFTAILCPDGLFVPIPEDKNTRGQVKNGRLEVDTVPTVMGGEWNGAETIIGTPFTLCVGALDGSGHALVRQNVAARFGRLNDGGAYGNMFRVNFTYDIRRSSLGYDFNPGVTLPAMYDPYLVQTELSCEVDGRQYYGTLPLALIGETPRKPSSAEWNQAYEKLKKDVLYFGIGQDPQIRTLIRDAHLHSAGELEYTRYYVLLSAVLYYESCNKDYEKIDAVLNRYVVVTGALMKAGDYACEYLFTRAWPKELGGGIVMKFINPFKNMMFNFIGQYIGPGSELSGDHERLPLFQTILQGTEEALEETITGDMKPSPDKLGYVVATYLMVCFVKHYGGYGDDPGAKGDVYRSVIAAAKDLTFAKFKAWLSGVIKNCSTVVLESIGKFCGTVYKAMLTDSMQRAMKLAGDTAFQNSVRESIRNGGLSTAQYLAAKGAKAAAIQAEQAIQQKIINDGAKMITNTVTNALTDEDHWVRETMDGTNVIAGIALNCALGGSKKDGSPLGTTVDEVLIGYLQDRFGLTGAQAFNKAADTVYDNLPVRVENGQLIFYVKGCGCEVSFPVMENMPVLIDAMFEICFDWMKIIWDRMTGQLSSEDLRDRLDRNTAIVEQQRQIIENMPPVEFRAR